MVNEFRGDRALLQPSLDQLAGRTGIAVPGVVPYIPRLRIAEEDSLALDERGRRARPTTDCLDICVVRLPYISNWLPYVAVADVDATIARARNLGATIPMDPENIPEVGRLCPLIDPTGAPLAVIKPLRRQK